MPVAKSPRVVNIFYQVIGSPGAPLGGADHRGGTPRPSDEFIPLAEESLPGAANIASVLHEPAGNNRARSDVLIGRRQPPEEGNPLARRICNDLLKAAFQPRPTIIRRLVGRGARRTASALLHPLPPTTTRALLFEWPRHGPAAFGGPGRLPGRTTTAAFHQGKPQKGAAMGRGLRHRAIPGSASRPNPADPRPADGDGRQAVHQGDCSNWDGTSSSPAPRPRLFGMNRRRTLAPAIKVPTVRHSRQRTRPMRSVQRGGSPLGGKSPGAVLHSTARSRTRRSRSSTTRKWASLRRRDCADLPWNSCGRSDSRAPEQAQAAALPSDPAGLTPAPGIR